LRLARPSGGAMEKADLNRLIHDAIELSGYERNQKRITILEEYDTKIADILLDREAMLQAVAGWRFAPATARGVPVEVCLLVRHLFRR